RTGGRARPPPNGAASSASQVPATTRPSSRRPRSATEHWHSPVYLLLMHWLLLNQTGPLRHVVGFPDLGLLRALRPLPTPSVGDGPSHCSRAGCPEPTGTVGRVPTFTVDRSTGPAPSYAPAPSP